MRRSIPCPTCKQTTPPDAPTYPFCSERCRLIDLGNWLDGKYVVPPADEPPPKDPER